MLNESRDFFCDFQTPCKQFDFFPENEVEMEEKFQEELFLRKSQKISKLCKKPMRHFIASITSSCFTFCEKRAESHHHGGNLKRNQIWEQKHKNPSLSLILPCTEWTLEVACSGGGTVIERTSALEKKIVDAVDENCV